MNSKVKQYISPSSLKYLPLLRFGNFLTARVWFSVTHMDVHASLHFRAREFRDNGMSPPLCQLRPLAWPAGWLIGLLLTTLRPPPTPRSSFDPLFVSVNLSHVDTFLCRRVVSVFSYFSIVYLFYPRPVSFDRFLVPDGDIRSRMGRTH